MNSLVLYSHESHKIIESMNLLPNGQYRGMFSDITLEKYKELLVSCELMPIDKAISLIDEYLKGFYDSFPVVEITEDDFLHALEILPPAKWKIVDDSESFFINEAVQDMYFNAYCRIKDKFFTFTGLITMSHDDIVNRCLTKEN